MMIFERPHSWLKNSRDGEDADAAGLALDQEHFGDGIHGRPGPKQIIEQLKGET
jgi:hypothetical protein